MKLPAGRYWIGDPCYVIGKGEFNFDWDKFCFACFTNDPTGRLNEGVVDHQGIRFAHFGTAHGDGGYQDQNGNDYGVDAGMLACIPEAFIQDVNEATRLGHFHQFDSDFDCKYDDGTIIFGHVEIETDWDDDDDDDDIEDYDDGYGEDDDEDEDES